MFLETFISIYAYFTVLIMCDYVQKYVFESALCVFVYVSIYNYFNNVRMLICLFFFLP